MGHAPAWQRYDAVMGGFFNGKGGEKGRLDRVLNSVQAGRSFVESLLAKRGVSMESGAFSLTPALSRWERESVLPLQEILEAAGF
ncbi:MAG: hypothetical protein P4N60_13260 [Verrucomicrobiae bacterium]|nr:hypothetical protein [Verrucomicrobiae bacterium]